VHHFDAHPVSYERRSYCHAVQDESGKAYRAHGETMIVQIPLFCLRHGTAAGLESSISNLVAGIVQTGTPVSLPISSFSRLNPEFSRWAQHQSNVAFKEYPLIKGGTWTRFVEETLFYNMETIRDPIVFPNYFLPPALRARSQAPFCYIHDCQHRVFPRYFSRQKRLWLDLNFQRTLDNAARVFLISEFERSQIARFFGEKRARNCTVVYNPVDWDRYTRGSASQEILSLSEKRFILSVSHQYAHKNTERIVDAFVLVAKRLPDLHLVLVGRESKNVSDRISAICDSCVRSRIVLTGFIKDYDLGRLYLKCQVFVLASEYEGFGMPAVEAMGFGVPVIVTNGSSLPEVTLGNAVYVEPGSDATVWADTIVEQLSTPRPEQYLIQAAAQVRARFQPVSIANSVISCLKSYN
jgi:glycosyltransferase involved in cell wall biosynthesis